jgi:putative effector of murein hydrolase
MFTVTAYIVRGLQLIFRSSKRTITERAEEMGPENDAIPLADAEGRQESQVTLDNTKLDSEASDLASGLATPQRAQDPSFLRATGSPLENDAQHDVSRIRRRILQTPLPLTRPQRWAAFINAHLDRIIYGMLFVFVGIPIYYSTGYAMPVHLTLNILAYFAALSISPRLKQFLHPVLVSSVITIVGIWILGLIRGDNLEDILESYKTGTNYQQLWRGQDIPKPGAGDIFSSVLDASIVALALPMYNYRLELKRHFFAIVVPNITISVASLFGYPALCYAIGISSKRSLSFAVRSLTLALATPTVTNLGGDLNTAAALAIMSGIFGVLIGPRMLKLLRIPEGKCHQCLRFPSLKLTQQR